MEKIYHSCGLSYEDGTVAPISKNGGCSNPIAYPFWEEVGDVNNRVQTRNQIRNTRPAYQSYILNYFTEKKIRNNEKRWLTSEHFIVKFNN